MAVVKVFDCNGSKDLVCFDTLSSVPYIEEDEIIDDQEPEEKNPFE